MCELADADRRGEDTNSKVRYFGHGDIASRASFLKSRRLLGLCRQRSEPHQCCIDYLFSRGIVSPHQKRVSSWWCSIAHNRWGSLANNISSIVAAGLIPWWCSARLMGLTFRSRLGRFYELVSHVLNWHKAARIAPSGALYFFLPWYATLLNVVVMQEELTVILETCKVFVSPITNVSTGLNTKNVLALSRWVPGGWWSFPDPIHSTSFSVSSCFL